MNEKKEWKDGELSAQKNRRKINKRKNKKANFKGGSNSSGV